jgi:hypothetical protein
MCAEQQQELKLAFANNQLINELYTEEEQSMLAIEEFIYINKSSKGGE